MPKILSLSSFWCIIIVLFFPGTLSAEKLNTDTQSLSVRPTLFDVSLIPNQEFRSTIRVLNTNNHQMTVSIAAAPLSQDGRIDSYTTHLHPNKIEQGSDLSEWITIETPSIVIGPQKTAVIPFTIKPPQHASPGSHNAALLVSTDSFTDSQGRVALGTSQVVATFLYTRVEGEVVTSLALDSFESIKKLYTSSQAFFNMILINDGTVSVRPRGEIVIQNMWGKTRGRIPIGSEGSLDRIMPNSSRQLKTEWRGEESLVDIGLYSATLILTYGDTTLRETRTFLIVPIRETLILILILVGLIFIIKRTTVSYVRSLLLQTGNITQRNISSKRPSIITALKEGCKKILNSLGTSVGEYKEGYRGMKFTAAALLQLHKTFLQKHRKGVYGLIGLFVVMLCAVLYIVEVIQKDRAYEVTVAVDGKELVSNSEMIAFKELMETENLLMQNHSSSSVSFRVVNETGVPGAGARLALSLVKGGFEVTEVVYTNDAIRDRSVIIFAPGLETDALSLSRSFGGIQVSAQPPGSTVGIDMILLVGRDLLEDQ